jgi:uncharacterized membrane protein
MFRRMSVVALMIVAGCSDGISPAARPVSVSKAVNGPISIRILPNLDGNDVTVTSFNQYDVVAGYRTSPIPRFFRSRTSIDYLTPPTGYVPGDFWPISAGINSGGQIVSGMLSDTAQRAFIWWHNDGTMLLNPTYGYEHNTVPLGCGAWAISDSGYVVGMCQPGSNFFVAEWSPNGTIILNECCGVLKAIAANHYITGFDLRSQDIPRALVWRPRAADYDVIGTLNGEPQQSSGLAVNDSGWVAGFGYTYPDTSAQLWVPNQPVRILSHLGQATGVDDAGNVVGYHRDSTTSAPVAFLWNFANGATFLPGLPGGGATAAVAINGGNREILGWAIDKSGLKHAVIWSF